MKRLSGILLLLFVFFLLVCLYIFNSTGYFRTIENQFDGTVLRAIALPGVEDVAVHHGARYALLSSCDRTVIRSGGTMRGDLYFLDMTDADAMPVNLTSKLDRPFAPHGISLWPGDSVSRVAVISHPGDQHVIELFDLIPGPELVHIGTINDDLLISPNDLVLIDARRFYVTNDHKWRKGFGRFMEDYLGIGKGSVVYYDGADFHPVAEDIAYANGIAYDSERQLVFVAATRAFGLHVYDAAPDKTLAFSEFIACNTGVDNIELSSSGELWIGAHPNLLKFASYASGKSAISPSEIIVVDYKGVGSYTLKTVYLNDGSEMSGASVAHPFDNYILAGNVMDEKCLILGR